MAEDVIARLLAVCLLSLCSCVSFSPVTLSPVALDERPSVAVLPFGFNAPVKKLSSIQSTDAQLSKEDEAQAINTAIGQIQADARWLFVSRLATAQGFRVVPPEEASTAAQELALKPGAIPTPEQLTALKAKLGADLVVVGTVLDYGKVRWQWLAAGMFTDISAETIIIGLASAWNPAIILGNVGFELLTSTPIWFGGGYLFGVAFRPVRVEVRAFETVEGYPIWQSMEESVYAWGALKELPESVRGRKESQLTLNLAEIMEALADELTEAEFTREAVQHHP